MFLKSGVLNATAMGSRALGQVLYQVNVCQTINSFGKRRTLLNLSFSNGKLGEIESELQETTKFGASLAENNLIANLL